MLRTVFIFIFICLFAVSVKASNKPNVILIYADDLGQGLLGCYGQKIIKTPHIDSLADEGVRFTNAHGSVYCAPARATLLTGLHEGRRNVWNISAGGKTIALDKGKLQEVKHPMKGHKQAEKEEVFLAQIAQKAGYKTAQFGKLDWGFQTTHERLKRHGWDYYLGYMDHVRAHGFYPTYLWRNGKRLLLPGNTHLNAGKTKESYSKAMTAKRRDKTGKKHYSQNVFIKDLLKFIGDNKRRPFFIYHSTQLPHGPVDIPEVHKDFKNDSRLTDVEKEYASMVKMLDDHVGLILKKLKRLKLDRNTVIFFVSDNGHETYYLKGGKGRTRKRNYHGENDVFKGTAGLAGMKWTRWQGGLAVPLIARWPGKFKKGKVSSLLTANYDFMPTLAELMRGKMPKGKDGISLVSELKGKKVQKKHDHIFIDNNVLITADGWKLLKANQRFYLFNIKKDPGEYKDLAETDPKKLNALMKVFKKEQNSQRGDL